MTDKINAYIHRPGRYRVKAPLVVAQQLGGGEAYVYSGGFLPANTRPSHIEHMLENGQITKTEIN